MSTTLEAFINYVNGDHDYGSYASDFIEMDLANDYLIWTAGDATVKDLMTHEPTAGELNNASSIIDASDPVTVALCLLMDASHNVGGAYYTHKVIGMGENKRYVYCVTFDGATASEPKLECWDDDTHLTTAKNVLGAGTPANSMVKGVCTTLASPGASWVGTALAGSGTGRYLLLNGGAGALSAPASGTVTPLYFNLKIVIPAGYTTPEVANFVVTCRYTYN